MVTAAFAAVSTVLLTAGPAFAQGGSEPAGGAATGEAVGATAGALVATLAMALLIAGHRTGRVRWLGRLAKFSERVSGLPAWAALSGSVLGGSLIIAVLGMYWDISLHIDNGRDPGPLANPAHYLILIGLFGVLLAGVLTMALARERPSPTAVHVGGDWWMPMGGVVITACGAFALSGFPLDDFWHRLFGQDVTLWGPTHLMLIGGGSLAVLGAMILMAEATHTIGGRAEREEPPFILRLRRGLLAGGFLVALSTFQGEFDFGVPQFRLVFHPVLIMLAAGIGLVAARYYLGRGGTLYAIAGFVAIRGFLAIMVGGVWGEVTPHFPLYVVEALVVELVLSRAAGRPPVAMGALAGVGIGTFGLAAEWGWSHLWMPVAWPADLLPEGAVLGFLAAVAGGAVGGFIGAALIRPRPVRAGRREHLAALAAGLVLVAIIGYALPLSSEGPQRAAVTLTDAGSGGERQVSATVRMKPRDAADDAEFLNVTAWQGQRKLVVDDLEKVGPGVYRTSEPIPVDGSWKAMVRLQKDDALVAMPLFLPEDKAIPAKAVPAPPRFTREFQLDREVLQRERKPGVSGSLTTTAYLVVLALAVGLAALIAWALLRLESGGEGRRPKRAAASGRPRLV